MKKWSIVFCLMFAAGIFYGHPASGFDISFDAKKSLLTVVMTHDLSGSMVKDTTKHFIKTVNITVNGVNTIVQNLQDQEKATGETVVYKLRLKKGDKVNVMGICNIFGSSGKDFVVP